LSTKPTKRLDVGQPDVLSLAVFDEELLDSEFPVARHRVLQRGHELRHRPARLPGGALHLPVFIGHLIGVGLARRPHDGTPDGVGRGFIGGASRQEQGSSQGQRKDQVSEWFWHRDGSGIRLAEGMSPAPKRRRYPSSIRSSLGHRPFASLTAYWRGTLRRACPFF
jgi:hypothetical protein